LRTQCAGGFRRIGAGAVPGCQKLPSGRVLATTLRYGLDAAVPTRCASFIYEGAGSGYMIASMSGERKAKSPTSLLIAGLLLFGCGKVCHQANHCCPIGKCCEQEFTAEFSCCQ
jgi:hypothetical protein